MMKVNSMMTEFQLPIDPLKSKKKNNMTDMINGLDSSLSKF